MVACWARRQQLPQRGGQRILIRIEPEAFWDVARSCVVVRCGGPRVTKDTWVAVLALHSCCRASKGPDGALNGSQGPFIRTVVPCTAICAGRLGCGGVPAGGTHLWVSPDIGAGISCRAGHAHSVVLVWVG